MSSAEAWGGGGVTAGLVFRGSPQLSRWAGARDAGASAKGAWRAGHTLHAVCRALLWCRALLRRRRVCSVAFASFENDDQVVLPRSAGTGENRGSTTLEAAGRLVGRRNGPDYVEISHQTRHRWLGNEIRRKRLIPSPACMQLSLTLQPHLGEERTGEENTYLYIVCTYAALCAGKQPCISIRQRYRPPSDVACAAGEARRRYAHPIIVTKRNFLDGGTAFVVSWDALFNTTTVHRPPSTVHFVSRLSCLAQRFLPHVAVRKFNPPPKSLSPPSFHPPRPCTSPISRSIPAVHHASFESAVIAK